MLIFYISKCVCCLFSNHWGQIIQQIVNSVFVGEAGNIRAVTENNRWCYLLTKGAISFSLLKLNF